MKQANKGSLPSISAANSWFIQKEWIFFSILRAKRGSRSITTGYNKLNTTQALYSNAISKVVHVQEQILYHFNIRQDPLDCIHRHKDGWASQPLQAYEPVFTLWNIVTARGEYTNGCLCHGNSFRVCQSLFLGIYIYLHTYIYTYCMFYIYIYVLRALHRSQKVNYFPKIFQNKFKHIREGLFWASACVFVLYLLIPSLFPW